MWWQQLSSSALLPHATSTQLPLLPTLCEAYWMVYSFSKSEWNPLLEAQKTKGRKLKAIGLASALEEVRDRKSLANS